QPTLALAGTHDSTAPTVVPALPVSRPMPTATTNNSTKASAKCMNDPAASTMIRCHPGFLRNERGSSAGSTSSSSVVPTICTKPPAGIALTPYSVSPLLRDQIVRPNPTKNWVAFIPNSLAVAKWPASCSMIDASRATTKMATPSRKLIRRSLPSSLPCSQRGACAAPRRRQVPSPGPAPRGARAPHPARPPPSPRGGAGPDAPLPRGPPAREEGSPPRHEGIPAPLVGGVVGGRGGPARLPRPPRDADRGERVLVQW